MAKVQKNRKPETRSRKSVGDNLHRFSPRTVFGRRILSAVVLLAGVVALLVGRQMSSESFRVGVVADRDIHAPRQAEHVDRAATEEKRLAAAARVKRSFNVLAFEDNVNELIGDLKAKTDAGESVQERSLWLDGKGMPRRVADELSQIDDSERIAALRLPLYNIYNRLVDGDRISEDRLTGLAAAAEEACREAGVDAEDIELVSQLFAFLVRDNLLMDKDDFERRKAAAAEAVEPVLAAIKKGEIIVRDGDLITAADMDVIDALNMRRTSGSVVKIISSSILILIALFIMGAMMKTFYPRYYKEEKYTTLYILIILLTALVFRGLVELNWSPYTLGLPIGMFTLFVCTLMRPGIALSGASMLGFLFAYTQDLPVEALFTALTGSLAAYFYAIKRDDKDNLLKASVAIGVNGLVMVCLLELHKINFGSAAQLMIDLKVFAVNLLTAPFNALIGFVIVVGALPLFERGFKILSPRRLLELSNPEEPLLKQMLLEAPGTYHHSLMVANLSETALKQLGGDSLLARAAVLYHDIGKTKRPYFFAENQTGGRNPHDDLTPSMSAMVIQGHVKDGVDIALREKLPVELIDFIRTHHGTSFISFFYKKACAQAEEGQTIDEAMFRYPGPKPFTLEQAVVMLADSCEASVRSLKTPNAKNIEATVNSIFEAKLEDHQLNDSPITLGQIEVSRQTFIKMLTTIYHSRVEYPSEFKRPGGEQANKEAGSKEPAAEEKRAAGGGEAAGAVSSSEAQKAGHLKVIRND